MSKLNVLYQFDDNYAPFAGVSMTTLFRNNTDIDELTVFLAAKDISEENAEKFRSLSAQFNRELVMMNTDGIYQKLEQLGAKSWNGSMATWMKMFLADSLPDSVDQLLYIDSDTLVPGSLMELAELNLGDYPLAAVIDSAALTSSERLSLGDMPYYNAGLMYFNIKLWREQDTQKKMVEHLRKNISRYPANDQDLMNDFFCGKILRLSPRYNFQGTHLFYKDSAYFEVYNWSKGMYYTSAEIAQARENPGIIHFFRFCGEYPWQPGNIHSCRAAFEKELADSLWAEFRYPKTALSPVFKIEKILYRLLSHKMFLKLLFCARHIDTQCI